VHCRWVWLCVSIQLSVDAHSGYEFPISLSSLLPSALGPLKLGGAKHHDDHHKYLRFNYQPFLTYRPRVVTGAPAPTSLN
jgi:sterol desaturase/sphingolipid hydroxylase (fatty acid hydroxylase superfamily)